MLFTPAALSRVSAYDWFGSLLGDPIGLALAGVVAADAAVRHPPDDRLIRILVV